MGLDRASVPTCMALFGTKPFAVLSLLKPPLGQVAGSGALRSGRHSPSPLAHTLVCPVAHTFCSWGLSDAAHCVGAILPVPRQFTRSKSLL